MKANQNNLKNNPQSLINHPLALALDQIYDITKFNRTDYIEWRSQQRGDFPNATRISLSPSHLGNMTIFTAKCYFGYLKCADIPKQVFEILNKSLDEYPIFPVRFAIQDTVEKDYWICSINFIAQDRFFDPNSILEIYIQLSLVASEAIQLLKESKYENFFIIPDDVLASEKI